MTCLIMTQAVEKVAQPFLFNRNTFGDLFQGLFRDIFFVLSYRHWFIKQLGRNKRIDETTH